MSDVDDDFMCEDEEDYGLVSAGKSSFQDIWLLYNCVGIFISH